jgi:hypothetical protein
MQFRSQTRALVFLALPFTPVSFAQPEADRAAVHKLLSDASGIGLAAGAAAPAFKLKDQNGRERDRGSLSGPNGLALVFFRSADYVLPRATGPVAARPADLPTRGCRLGRHQL